jgi:hypothetical protein
MTRSRRQSSESHAHISLPPSGSIAQPSLRIEGMTHKSVWMNSSNPKKIPETETRHRDLRKLKPSEDCPISATILTTPIVVTSLCADWLSRLFHGSSTPSRLIDGPFECGIGPGFCIFVPPGKLLDPLKDLYLLPVVH